MSYVVIENFAGGVDRSRPIYASNAGTLWSGINGHMTRGGDFEKRKEFSLFAQLSNETIQSSWLTYKDFENNPSQLIVNIPKFIGVVADAEGIIILLNIDYANVIPPTGMRYVVIKHPLNTYESSLNAPLGIKVISYDVYNGKAFYVIEFDNGDVFPYYDGLVVNDFIEGIDFVGTNVSAEPLYYVGASFDRALNREYALNPSIGLYAISVVIADTIAITYQISGFALSNGSTLTRTKADGTDSTVIGTVDGSGNMLFQVLGDLDINGRAKKTYRYSLNIIYSGGSINIGLSAKPIKSGTFVKTYKRKVYLINASILDFGAVDNAIKFDRDDDAGTGFINMSTQTSGSDALISLQSYQDKMAIFSRRNIQVWYMDTDPLKNASYQILNNTGTIAAKSVVGFGDIDVFYLADTGVRSIRARDASNTASVNDVGTPVDTLIRGFINSLTDAQIQKAVGVVEPIDGRYMLAIGTKILVFSYFPSKSISAWSWYEMGYEIDDFFTVGNRLYARSGYNLYLVGGVDNLSYGSDYTVTAQLPFITGGKAATYKQIKGVDIATEGGWNVSYLTNPNDINEQVHCGLLDGITNTEDNIAAIGHFTHIAPLLTHQDVGYASISNVTIHYDKAEDE